MRSKFFFWKRNSVLHISELQLRLKRVKAHLHYQEVIIYLNASLKSTRHSVVLVWEDRFPSCAVGSVFVFFFFLNFSQALLPAWPAKSEGIRGLSTGRD